MLSWQTCLGHPWCLVCSAKKYKCALGTTISFTTGLWILPGKESWAPDNISTGSLPAKTLQIISSVSSLQQFKLLSLSVPCPFRDWTNVLVCFVYWSVSAGAYLDAGYNPFHVLLGHLMTHPEPVTVSQLPHNFLLHWLCVTQGITGLQRVALSASLVM